MSKYPLDQEALVEEYGDLLIKIALKAYMKEQAQLLEQEEAEAAPVPAPKGNVVAAAFRQVNLEDAKETILAGNTAGNSTANKNNIFTVGAVIFLAKVAIRIVAIQHAAVFSLSRGIIALTIAENTVSTIAVITYGDIHSSFEPFLGSDVSITIHSAKLLQRIGVGLGTITSSTLFGHSGDRQHDGQHKDSQQNA